MRYCTRGCREVARNVANVKPRERIYQRNAWKVLRARVLAEESTCWLCFEPIDPASRYPDARSGSADHVRSIAEGGDPLDRDNVRAAHLRCNTRRGSYLGGRVQRRMTIGA